MEIRWGRSEEGYVSSKCGRYEISPVFFGSTTPQAFLLVGPGGVKIGSYFDTQRQAKERAQSYEDAESESAEKAARKGQP